jgi:hypothetical protein
MALRSGLVTTNGTDCKAIGFYEASDAPVRLSALLAAMKIYPISPRRRNIAAPVSQTIRT